MDDLLISVSRQRPDGEVEYVAHSADPAVVEATLDALERVLRGPERRPLLSLVDREVPPLEPNDG